MLNCFQGADGKDPTFLLARSATGWNAAFPLCCRICHGNSQTEKKKKRDTEIKRQFPLFLDGEVDLASLKCPFLLRKIPQVSTSTLADLEL